MLQTIPELDKKGLREFGLLFSAIFATIFGLLLPWIFGHDFPLWPWIVAGVISSIALIYAPLLKPFYHLWMRFGLVLGWINTRIILSLIFYLMFMPIGLVMRLFGNDLLSLRLEKDSESYRVISHKTESARMEKPF